MKTIIINNLEWQEADDGIQRTWEKAVDYAVTLGKGWRLPTIEELFSIIDFTICDPACKIEDCRSSYYWSSSPDANNSSLAWYVNFGLGYVFNFNKDSQSYARCVRDVDKNAVQIVAFKNGVSIKRNT